MNFDIDATWLKFQLQKLILTRRIEKIFLIQRAGKIVVNYIKKKDEESDLKDLLLLLVKQNLDLLERAALKAALYANAKNIRTELTKGVEQIETAIKEQGILPLLITPAGRIIDRNKNEIDLSGFFEEVQKFLPAGIGRVGDEEE